MGRVGTCVQNVRTGRTVVLHFRCPIFRDNYGAKTFSVRFAIIPGGDGLHWCRYRIVNKGCGQCFDEERGNRCDRG